MTARADGLRCCLSQHSGLFGASSRQPTEHVLRDEVAIGLLDTMTVRRGKRKGEAVAELQPDTIARLELLGQERALIYKTLVLTGLSKSELASLTVGQVHLDGDFPFLALDAANEKNRQGSQIPLRRDLAADLADWINRKQERVYRVTGIASNGHSAAVIPMTRKPEPLPASMPLFTVPGGAGANPRPRLESGWHRQAR